MAVNVTYLLGAGASFETIPLVKEVKDGDKIIRHSLAQEILNLAKQYQELPNSLSASVLQYDPELNSKLIEGLKNLGKSSSLFSSPDTFIKSLYLQKLQRQVEESKKNLSFYLTITQLLNDNVDKRYIPFFASILEKSDVEADAVIPDNIKIVTWNYDFQIELALQHFAPILDEFYKIQKHYKIVPNIDTTINFPSIIHLNGLAGLFRTRKQEVVPLFHKRDSGDKVQFLASSLEQYSWLQNKNGEIKELLTFAWELTEGNNDRLDQAENIFRDTEVLVVIGYSFPFFNREVDGRLIRALLEKRDGRSKPLKIYIQDPLIDKDQIQFLRERFKIRESIPVEGFRSVNQFFLPPEL